MRTSSITNNQPDAVIAHGLLIVLQPISNSSNIAAIGYRADACWLVVRFLPATPDGVGAVYLYRHVAASRFVELMDAPSKGKYLAQHIIGKTAYPFEKLS